MPLWKKEVHFSTLFKRALITWIIYFKNINTYVQLHMRVSAVLAGIYFIIKSLESLDFSVSFEFIHLWVWSNVFSEQYLTCFQTKQKTDFDSVQVTLGQCFHHTMFSTRWSCCSWKELKNEKLNCVPEVNHLCKQHVNISQRNLVDGCLHRK